MAPASAQFRRHYAKLTLPVSIFGGAGDKIVDVESHSVRLHRDLPRSTLTVVPGAGHMVHYALADEIVDAINLMIVDQSVERHAPAMAIGAAP
jgi:pimeloyl-ACP methyl ester carboxylesterase